MRGIYFANAYDSVQFENREEDDDALPERFLAHSLKTVIGLKVESIGVALH